MLDFVTNTVAITVAVFAIIVSVLGLSSVYSQIAKADYPKIEKQMLVLEKLYNELNNFQNSENYLKHGYSTRGQGKWSDAIKAMDKDKNLSNYMAKLLPAKIDFAYPFPTKQTLRPLHLWNAGRVYYRNGGKDNKDTNAVKAKFIELFRLHKLQKNK